jgi:double-strand break repair protein MRE11
LDNIKVEQLVQEFLTAQSLKILPQAPFGDAVNQFVNKDDKHAMEMFVSESLAGQVKQMLDLDSDEEDLDSAMERYRAKAEQQFTVGVLKQTQRRKLKPKPDGWDSDLDGHWEQQPEAIEIETISQPSAARSGSGLRDQSPPEDNEMMDVDEELVAPVKKAPTKRATTSKAAKPAPAKKVPAKKAPARGGRGRKAAAVVEDDEEDVLLDDEDDMPQAPPKRSQPQRASARTRQTKLNFSQAAASQKAVEISDDEISDDDDAFEALPATRSRRR